MAMLHEYVVRIDFQHFLAVLVSVLILWLSLHLILIFFEAQLVVGFELLVGLQFAQLYFVVISSTLFQVDEVHESVDRTQLFIYRI